MKELNSLYTYIWEGNVQHVYKNLQSSSIFFLFMVMKWLKMMHISKVFDLLMLIKYSNPPSSIPYPQFWSKGKETRWLLLLWLGRNQQNLNTSFAVREETKTKGEKPVASEIFEILFAVLKGVCFLE